MKQPPQAPAGATQFACTIVMHNGNKITKKNWQKLVVRGIEPCTNIHGVRAIDEAKERDGAYYPEYRLRWEQEPNTWPRGGKKGDGGYIWREVNWNGGISGHYKTPKAAVLSVIGSDRHLVYLED